MAKIKLNPMFKSVRGKLDDIVFRKYRGEIIMGPMPEYDDESSEAQLAHQKRFQMAASFGNRAMGDPEMCKLYEAAGKERDMNPFALCIADYFNAPEVTNLDLLNYTGKVADTIAIETKDDFGVARLEMTLSDDDMGTLIESGWAVETVPGKGIWSYTVTQAAPAGVTVCVRATAYDRPNNTGSMSGTKRI